MRKHFGCCFCPFHCRAIYRNLFFVFGINERLLYNLYRICGYVPVKKVDVDYAAKHIKSIMKQNQFDKVVVKLFHDYKAFLTRAEGMNNIASVEQQDTRKHEEMIKGLLLDISL